jgi:hypothetical protein
MSKPWPPGAVEPREKKMYRDKKSLNSHAIEELGETTIYISVAT